MSLKKEYLLSILLLISGLLLSVLVPGGPIENRDFSHISPLVLLGFNIYLTALGLGSFVLIAYVLRSGRNAGLIACAAGVSYLVVYAIDLLGWFPQSPSDMSSTLFTIEVLGLIAALPLVYLSCQLAKGLDVPSERNRVSWSSMQWFMLIVGAMVIVIFATWSSMTSAG